MKFYRYLVPVLFVSLLVEIPVMRAQEGPQSGPSETVAKPRKNNNETTPDSNLPKIPSEYKKDKEMPAGLPTYKADVTTVSLDVTILDNKGHFIPKIPRGNFRVLEDGSPQQISQFSMGEAPLTVCMVVEFSNRFQQFWSSTWYQTLSATYGFVQTLKPEDYVAVIAYDLKPEILSDFSTDRNKTYDALQRLRIAGFSEANLYDALIYTTERMQEIEGRKAIVLISSGIDTFSKVTFDQTRKKLQAGGVPIYAIGLMQTLRELMDAAGYMGPLARLDFLQADNQMRTFAKETGGLSFFPRFYGEFPSIFQSIAQALRNEYTLGYHPTNAARDGKFRKLKVELVNPATNEPLRIVDERGKPIKYQIIAKAGYTAPRSVE
ncbi:MAG: VWA domain-containing protein [Bryobacteraceae bacterium]